MRMVCSFLTLCVLLTVLESDLSEIALGTVRRASPIFFRLVDFAPRCKTTLFVRSVAAP